MVDSVAATVNRFARKSTNVPVPPRRRYSSGRDSARLPYQGPAALVAGLPATLRCQDRARAGSGGAGNPSHACGSCGHPEANVVVPVVRRVPVAVGRAAVRAVVIPRAAAVHAIRAYSPRPEASMTRRRKAASPKWLTNAHTAFKLRCASASPMVPVLTASSIRSSLRRKRVRLR